MPPSWGSSPDPATFLASCNQRWASVGGAVLGGVSEGHGGDEGLKAGASSPVISVKSCRPLDTEVSSLSPCPVPGKGSPWPQPTARMSALQRPAVQHSSSRSDLSLQCPRRTGKNFSPRESSRGCLASLVPSFWPYSAVTFVFTDTGWAGDAYTEGWICPAGHPARTPAPSPPHGSSTH